VVRPFKQISKAIGSFLSQKWAVFISMYDIFCAVETREEASWLTSHFDLATRHQSRRIKHAICDDDLSRTDADSTRYGLVENAAGIGTEGDLRGT
jgi:hypothetical protein